jgi:hypothetical protein
MADVATIGTPTWHDNWYIYHYFDGFDTPGRYPAGSSPMMGWKALIHSSKTVEHIRNIHMGRSVLKEPFIKHSATSQLALLSEGEYQAGIQKIKTAIEEAEAKNEQVVFSSDIQVKMFLGYKPR